MNGALGSTSVLVNNGGTLGGTGTIAGPITVGEATFVSTRGAIAPGNSVGKLATGGETWNPAGSYIWEINDVDGVDNAGNTAGNQGASWDVLDITGTLTIASTSGSPFLIKLTTLSGATPGAAADFNPALAYEWTIARTTGGVTGFDASLFVLDTSSFVAEDGDFAVTSSGGNINISYTPVPEPGSFGVLALAGVGLLSRRRRRSADILT